MTTPKTTKSRTAKAATAKRATSAPAQANPLRDPALYANRELSQLDFNFRVLAQAQDPSVPLLERLRFLCISCTNLDEFFEIRAATVRHTMDLGLPTAADGMSPAQILEKIHDRAAQLVQAQYDCWNDVLRPTMAEAGIAVLGAHRWNARQKRWLRAYFRNEIMPVLSPLGLDPAHPFPKILNKSLNIVVVVKGKDAFGRAGHLAIVRAPRSLPRIIQLPPSLSENGQGFVFLSSVLSYFVDELFPGMEVKGAYQFRVTRNSELIVDEEEVENLASALRDELVGRGYRPAVRLEITDDAPKAIVRTLLQNFELTENAVYRINGPVNLSRAIQLYDLVPRPELKYPAFTPRTLRDGDAMFELVADGDVLLHHPFDSFSDVIELLKQAATDPAVGGVAHEQPGHADNDDQVQHQITTGTAQDIAYAIGVVMRALIEHAVKPTEEAGGGAMAAFLDGFQHRGAERRGQNQCHQYRQRHRGNDSDRELTVNRTGRTAEEGHRDKYRGKHHRDTHQRALNLAH